MSLCRLLGHKGRVFDARFSGTGRELLTASEDGTAVLWDVGTLKAVATLTHNKETEVLRAAFLDAASSSLVATGGADGRAILWKAPARDASGSAPSSSSRYAKLAVLEHDSASQIYACEAVPGETVSLVTAADNRLHLWDLTATPPVPTHAWAMTELAGPASGHTGVQYVPYGGPRNPDHQVFLFDAKARPDDVHAVAVAVSDGTVRMVDLRARHVAASTAVPAGGAGDTAAHGKRPRSSTAAAAAAAASPWSTLSLAHLPPPLSRPAPTQPAAAVHPTALSFSGDGLSLLVALGSGDVAVVDVRAGAVRAVVRAHARTCFGAAFVPTGSPLWGGLGPGSVAHGSAGEDDGGGETMDVDRGNDDEGTDGDGDGDGRAKRRAGAAATSSSSPSSSSSSSSSSSPQQRCVTWSSDGSVRLWDVTASGLVSEPLATRTFPDYPLYACAVNGVNGVNGAHRAGAAGGSGAGVSLACAGGNGEASFVGTPVHVLRDG